MPDTHWQIEQGCPQCGAPVTLDETDRLLVCPFCRTRLYLVSEDHFHYYILPPAAKADGELFYFPYRRLRGSLFSVNASEVTHRFIDTNTLAVSFPGLSYSLGLRPQILKLHFVAPSTQGRFIAPDLPAESIPSLGNALPSVLYQEFIGEVVSLIHAPILLRGGTLYDAVLGEPISVCETDDLERLQQSPPPTQKQVRFIPTLCPYCGWDMEGEKDSLVLICQNCNSAWECPKNGFKKVGFTVMRPPPRNRGRSPFTYPSGG